MDQVLETELTNVVDNKTENNEVDVMDNMLDGTIIVKEEHVCDYSGDVELMRMKKEFCDSELLEQEQPNNINPVENNQAVSLNEDLEMKVEVLDAELNLNYNDYRSTEYSSGVSSCSDASRDSSNTSENSFEKSNDEIIKNAGSLEQDVSMDVDGVVNATFDGTPKLEDLKIEVNDMVSNEADSEVVPHVPTDSSYSKMECVSMNQENGHKTGQEPKAKPSILAAYQARMKLRESNPHEITIPLIGKKIDWGFNDKLMPFDAELAKKINQQNLERNGAHGLPFHEYIRRRQARTQEQIDAEDTRELLRTHRYAVYVLKNLERILLQMQNDEPNEDKIIKYFFRFLRLPVSPLIMIHIPQFVHTVMYLKGSPEFSPRVHEVAKDCYDKIRVLFPIPIGYNFETVYTNEIKKCMPDECDVMDEYPLLYDWSSESEGEDEENEAGDSAFSEEDEDDSRK